MVPYKTPNKRFVRVVPWLLTGIRVRKVSLIQKQERGATFTKDLNLCASLRKHLDFREHLLRQTPRERFKKHRCLFMSVRKMFTNAPFSSNKLTGEKGTHEILIRIFSLCVFSQGPVFC